MSLKTAKHRAYEAALAELRAEIERQRQLVRDAH